MPKMTHPSSKHAIEVSADQVRTYASQGWVEKTPRPKKKTSARTTNPAPAAEIKE